MNFPRRNRIISGLSKAVFVVETRQTGGAMITAKIALDQGRDVFALPGNVGIAPAEGTNFLIKSSLAKLITSHKDILEEMGITQESAREAKHFDVSQLNLFEAKIFNALSDTPVQIDQLAATTGLPVSDCLVHLLGLEFKSIARQLPGKMFIRNE
jgi:DNA processing protein